MEHFCRTVGAWDPTQGYAECALCSPITPDVSLQGKVEDTLRQQKGSLPHCESLPEKEIRLLGREGGKKIPTRFKLFGQTINVVFVPEKFTESDGRYGFSSYRLQEIQLRPSTLVLPISQEQMLQTFWHELTHFVLYFAEAAYNGKSDYMHQDEGFVELVGNLLHQAVTTFEFDEWPGTHSP